jgi:hypothetical protein
MVYQHAMQSSRFELKYIIDENCARGIRQFISSHLEPDSYARPDMDNAYPISSLYLDNSGLTLFGQTVQGMKNRFKLRIRFYDDDPSHPAFLEIKRRVTDVIKKERATVTRDAVRRVLRGDGPRLEYLKGDPTNPKSGSALQNFCHLCQSIDARGMVYVSYVREAYVSPNSDQVRVTFDRQLLGSPYEQGSPLQLPTQGAWPDVGGVILELKFTDRFPPWMREVVQAFNLQRTSVPKYIYCINALGIRPGALGMGVT